MNAFKEIFPSIEELDVAEVKPQNIFKGLLKDEEFVDKIYIMRRKKKKT